MASSETKSVNISLEENLKKALTELLILHLLAQREYYIGELAETLRERSGDVLQVVFPYSAVYRMLEDGHIFECAKRIAPDGRKRQFYQITDQGRAHYAKLMEIYNRFSGGVQKILDNNGEE